MGVFFQFPDRSIWDNLRAVEAMEVELFRWSQESRLQGQGLWGLPRGPAEQRVVAASFSGPLSAGGAAAASAELAPRAGKPSNQTKALLGCGHSLLLLFPSPPPNLKPFWDASGLRPVIASPFKNPIPEQNR